MNLNRLLNSNLPLEEKEAWMSKTLIEGFCTSTKPVTAKVSFDYHLIPGHIRVWLAKRLFSRTLKNLRKTPRTPNSYADNSLDIVGSSCYESNSPAWSWPEGKECALVLSHDVDNKRQEKGIDGLLDVANHFNMKATYSFVGGNLGYYTAFIKTLSESGFDLALHDVKHDNTIAFLKESEISARLEEVRAFCEQYNIKGFRSPSWYVSPALWLALPKRGFVYDCSALDTWPFFEKDRNFGVQTFFPFSFDSLVVIPNTIPFELPFLCGIDGENTLDFWKPKFDRIAKSGGLIMFNAHPDSWYCGNRKAIAALKDCLDYILNHYNVWHATAHDVADHFNEQKKARKTIELKYQDHTVHIPHHSRPIAPWTNQNDPLNMGWNKYKASLV